MEDNMSTSSSINLGHAKENVPTVAGVVWAKAEDWQEFYLSTPPRPNGPCSALRQPPAKSILKRRASLLPAEPTVSPREETPEPSSPKSDPHYLSRPISLIINDKATFTELNEGYSTLTARLRACVDDERKPRKSWPLFTPMRVNSEALFACIHRDVGRALEDPAGAADSEDDEIKPSPLPTPQRSPRKKQGMTAAQVKHARDLCTTTHCVLKLLAFLLGQKAVFEIFSDNNLDSLLTAILAIPLARTLPTLYTRKTCALAIWVLQCQRLPEHILEPAADRIAHAIGRGLDGQLGKEGKKGACNDGLRAVHDLSLHAPEVFVPAFAAIFPSVLRNLLASTVALRVQACHALGGYAYASTLLAPCELHGELAEMVQDYIKVPCQTTPRKANTLVRSPSMTDTSPIVRALRNSLSNEEPAAVTQGPVWGLSILGHLTLLLRSSVFDDLEVRSIVKNLIGIPRSSKCQVVRQLTAIAWRSVVWGLFQPRLEVTNEDSDDRAYVALANSVPEFGNGLCLTAGILAGQANVDSLNTNRYLVIVEQMVTKTPRIVRDGLAILQQLVAVAPDGDEEFTFDPNSILPLPFFSANPGLLTEHFENIDSSGLLAEMEKDVFRLEHLVPIHKDSLVEDKVMTKFFALWKKAALQLEAFRYDRTVFDEVIKTWRALVDGFMVSAEDNPDHEQSNVVAKACDVLTHLVNQEFVCKANNSPSASSPARSLSVKPSQTRIRVLSRCWEIVSSLVQKYELDAGQKLLGLLMSCESTWSNDAEAHREWAHLCASVSITCSEDKVKAYWGAQVDDSIPAWIWPWTTEAKRMVWQAFLSTWEENGKQEGLLTLLRAPLMRENGWSLTEEDLKLWGRMLEYGISHAWDVGDNALDFVESVVEDISGLFEAGSMESVRIGELLLNSVKSAADEARSVPAAFADFLNSTLQEMYPPSPSQVRPCLWALRALTDVLSTWPESLSFDLLDRLQEGLCKWLSDDSVTLADDSYSSDISTLYESTLVCLSYTPKTTTTLEHFQPLVDAIFVGRDDKPKEVFDTFRVFWTGFFGDFVDSEEWPENVRSFFGILPAEPSTAVVEEVVEVVPEALELSHDFVDNGRIAAWAANVESISAQTPQRTRPFLAAVDDSPADTLTASSDSEDDEVEVAHDLNESLFTPPVKFTFKAREPLFTPKKDLLSNSSEDSLFTPTKAPFPPAKSPCLRPANSTSADATVASLSPSPYIDTSFAPAPIGLVTPPSSPVKTTPRTPRAFSRLTPCSPSRIVFPMIHGSPCSPSRRRQEGNKENFGVPASPSRKRTLPDEIALTGSPSGKRGRPEDSAGPSNIFAHPAPVALEDVFTALPTVNPRKRKRVTVEVPTVASLNLEQGDLRRVRSLDDEVQGRHLDDDDDDKPLDKSFITLLREDAEYVREHKRLRVRRPAGFGPRVIKSLDYSDETEPSSDDSPHIGQVTPHHLISPALKGKGKAKRADAVDDDGEQTPTKRTLRRRKSEPKWALNGKYWAGVLML